MLGRAGHTSNVSFFAFQDIITGVAGVMLILVLALAGEAWVAARDRKEAAPSGIDAEARRRAVLAAEETRLRAEVGRLEEALRRSGAQRSRQERQAALRRVTEDFQARAAELRRQLAALPPEATSLPAPVPAEREYRELLAENRRLEAQYREKLFRPAIPAEHRGRKVIVLECRERDWLLTMPGEAVRKLGRDAVPPLPAARRELFAQLRKVAVRQHWLAVLARPGAGGYVTMLLTALEEEFPELAVAVEPLPEETI